METMRWAGNSARNELAGSEYLAAWIEQKSKIWRGQHGICGPGGGPIKKKGAELGWAGLGWAGKAKEACSMSREGRGKLCYLWAVLNGAEVEVRHTYDLGPWKTKLGNWLWWHLRARKSLSIGLRGFDKRSEDQPGSRVGKEGKYSKPWSEESLNHSAFIGKEGALLNWEAFWGNKWHYLMINLR